MFCYRAGYVSKGQTDEYLQSVSRFLDLCGLRVPSKCLLVLGPGIKPCLRLETLEGQISVFPRRGSGKGRLQQVL